MNILFGMKPDIAGRFYKYLAEGLQKRIQVREEQQVDRLRKQAALDESV